MKKYLTPRKRRIEIHLKHNYLLGKARLSRRDKRYGVR